MSKSIAKKFFFATQVPNCFDLKYFIARIQPSEAKDLSVQTDFQWQIVKARFLIWKYQELIAAPVPGRPDSIYFIVPKHHVENGFIFEFAKDSNIKLNGPYGLTNLIYQQCITYSIGFRLSPDWNKIGGTWIYSSDFLNSAKALPAVVWEPNVAGGFLRASIQATRGRMNFFDLADLGVDIEKLKTYGQVPISGSAYILPKQKECKLVNLLTSIPSNCPFPTYHLLRKHWKNTYGFRLPHDGSSMLYVQVRFGWSKELYTYPIICVRPTKLRRLSAQNGLETISAFAQSLTERCQTVCGMPISCKIFQDESPPILQSSQNFIRDETSTLKELFVPHSGPPSKSLSQSFSLNTPELSQAPPKPLNRSPVPDPSAVLHNFRDPSNKEEEILEIQMLNLPIDDNAVAEMPTKPKFVPTFTKSQSAGPNFTNAINPASVGGASNTKKKFVPVFKPRTIVKPQVPEGTPKSNLIFSVTKPQEPSPTEVPTILSPLQDQLHPINLSKMSVPVTIKPSRPKKTEPKPENIASLTQMLQLPSSPATDRNQVPVGPSPAKIRRSNPTLIDVTTLAKSKQLNKATMPSLREFCKAHKIFGVSKDKKDVLMEKVYRYFGMSVPTGIENKAVKSSTVLEGSRGKPEMVLTDKIISDSDPIINNQSVLDESRAITEVVLTETVVNDDTVYLENYPIIINHSAPKIPTGYI